jgi:hypothetical protein
MTRFLIPVLLIGFGVISCKKNELNGSSNIHGKVVHHTKAISGARVFIKFDATEFPGKDTLVYDAKVIADANGNFSISCYKGEYYLYGYGQDLAIDPPFVVVGGVPVKIRKNEDADVQIAVTEGD